MTRQNSLNRAASRNAEILRSVDGSALLQRMYSAAMGEVEVTAQQVTLMKDLRSCLIPSLQSTTLDTGDSGLVVNLVSQAGGNKPADT